MTPMELIKQEAEEITARTGRYIPPYRMSQLMVKAQKIVDILQKDSMISYEECGIVLRIVTGIVSEMTGNADG